MLTHMRFLCVEVPSEGWREPDAKNHISALGEACTSSAAEDSDARGPDDASPVLTSSPHTSDVSAPQQRGRNDNSPWVRKRDKRTGRFYYVNFTSKKTRWKEPDEGWRDDSASKRPPKQQKSRESNKNVDMEIKQIEVTAQEQPDAMTTARAWKRKVDPRTGRFYYVNKETKETSWKMPEHFVASSGTSHARRS